MYPQALLIGGNITQCTEGSSFSMFPVFSQGMNTFDVLEQSQMAWKGFSCGNPAQSKDSQQDVTERTHTC